IGLLNLAKFPSVSPGAVLSQSLAPDIASTATSVPTAIPPQASPDVPSVHQTIPVPSVVPLAEMEKTPPGCLVLYPLKLATGIVPSWPLVRAKALSPLFSGQTYRRSFHRAMLWMCEEVAVASPTLTFCLILSVAL